VFGQEFTAAFQPPDREKERPSWNKGAKALGMISVCPHAEGGMRFTFPPDVDFPTPCRRGFI
jgi:hypothetical protein